MDNRGFRYSKQQELFAKREIIGFGDPDFYIEEIERNKANKIIIKNHYSHKYYNATYIHLGVFINKELIGVLQYGYAMNPASGSSVVKGTELNEYLELNRMWLDDKAPRNSESKAISFSIKYIRNKFNKIKWIQSFADERCGRFGVVYQAANFGFYGEHTAIFWTIGNEIFHNSLMTRNPKLSKAAAYIQENKQQAHASKLRQFRYLYFIDQREIKNCLLKQEPYPKHYKEVA
jgi:adenine modification enzyme